MLCQAGFFALRARRLMRFLAAPSMLAIAAIAGAPPALAVMPVTDAAVAASTSATAASTSAAAGTLSTISGVLTAMQTLLTTQLSPTTPVLNGTPPTYAVVSAPLTIACPTNLTYQAAILLTATCGQLNTDIVAFFTAKNEFEAAMTALAGEIQTISTLPVDTTSNILGASLRLQAVQARQANLIGRHMANVEWMKTRLSQAEKEFMRAKAIMKFGKL